METRELRALGWSVADAERIVALPMTVKYYECEDVPITVTGRWLDGHPFDAEVLAWHGNASRPFPWSEVFWGRGTSGGGTSPGIEIDRAEFDYLRRLARRAQLERRLNRKGVGIPRAAGTPC